MAGGGCAYLLEAQWELPTRVATQGLPSTGVSGARTRWLAVPRASVLSQPARTTRPFLNYATSLLLHSVLYK